jgi:hypothetical protein
MKGQPNANPKRIAVPKRILIPKRIVVIAAGSLLAMLPLAACHSSHVELTVENRTGGPIRLLEVDYPSASFGADSLAAGATMHYRVQLQGSGPLKVQYTAQDNRQFQSQGPDLAQNQEGRLEIVLEPAGKAEFSPQLTASH